jgi:hypothetical protein
MPISFPFSNKAELRVEVAQCLIKKDTERGETGVAG